MSTTFRLNPEQIAYYEANGWRAYYERKWLRVLWLLVRLCQAQFHIPFPMSLLAAYYTTRASAAWVPVDHDISKVLAYLTSFYAVARRYSGLKFNVGYVAALELQYFDVHRRLVEATDKSEFVETMADLHSAIFGLTPAQMLESAEWRVKAADTVDLITGKKSTDVEGDWSRLEEYLRKCYGSIQRELAPQ
jgi:hypothetical protein